MRKAFALLRLFGNSRFLPRRLQRAFIERETRGKEFEVVVDIGAGKAPHKKIIRHRRYVAIDCEDRGGASEVLIEDINQGTSLSENTADLIICTEVLEHTKEPQAVVRELYRIVKPGGMVLVTAPMTWPVHEAPNDYYRYTPFGLEYLFHEAGFSAITIEAENGYWYTMLALFASRLKLWVFFPLIVLVNLLGYVVFRLERGRAFPLGVRVRAIK